VQSILNIYIYTTAHHQYLNWLRTTCPFQRQWSLILCHLHIINGMLDTVLQTQTLKLHLFRQIGKSLPLANMYVYYLGPI